MRIAIKGDGSVRIGEEDPRGSIHVCRRLAIALNLGPRERASNPDAIAACGKELDKLNIETIRENNRA